MVIKNRTVTIVSAIVIILLLAAAGVSVWAFTRYQIRSSVDVKYNATGIVEGEARAWFIVGDDEKPMVAKVDDNTTDHIAFGKDTESQEKSLYPNQNIVLTNSKNYVIFKYSFTNTGKTPYSASLNYVDIGNDDKNVSIKYRINGTGDWQRVNNNIYDKALTVNQKIGDVNGEGTFEVKVQFVSDDSDAMFSGSFEWELKEVVESETNN